jgi:hypothetical protein
VKLGNNPGLTVQGKGMVRLWVNGIVFMITWVFYVLDLKNNLLSIGQLQEKGIVVLIQYENAKSFVMRKV